MFGPPFKWGVLGPISLILKLAIYYSISIKIMNIIIRYCPEWLGMLAVIIVNKIH